MAWASFELMVYFGITGVPPPFSDAFKRTVEKIMGFEIKILGSKHNQGGADGKRAERGEKERLLSCYLTLSWQTRLFLAKENSVRTEVES